MIDICRIILFLVCVDLILCQLPPDLMKQLQDHQAQQDPEGQQPQGQQPQRQQPQGQPQGRGQPQPPPQRNAPPPRQSAPEPTTPPPRQEREAEDPAACTAEYYAPSGEIESPNFPENYPSEASCMYRIFTDKIVKLEFFEFDIELTRDCNYDYVQVVFEATTPNPGVTPPRYCGQGLDKIEGGKLSGKGPIVVSFRSDDSDNFKGYKFSYKFELNGPDPCESNPCQNEATCMRMADYYECKCVPGYAGINCEIDKDDCAVYPCKNGGECIDGLESFTCECINYFTGDVCEIPPKPCESNPCQNGGLCVERIPDYVCSCPRSFMGDYCQDEIPTLPPPTTLEPITQAPEELTDPPAAQSVEETTEPNEKTTDQPEGDENEIDNANTNAPYEPASHGRGGIIAAVIIIILLALIIIGAFLWYWLKYHRKLEGKPTKELTLINMKTKSHRGDRRKGNIRSQTTSIKSLTMQPKEKNLLGKLRQMSEDIIMEEVTSDSDASNVKSKKRHSKRHKFDQEIDVVESPNQRIKRHTIPMAPNEISSITSNPYGHNTDIGQSFQLSPDAAFNFLQHLKGNEPAPIEDGGFVNEAFNDSTHPLYPDYQQMQDIEFFPRKSNGSYYPPNVPHNQSMGQDGPNSIALNPEEAADIVNHLLVTNSKDTGNLKPNEALDFMRQLRDTRYGDGDRPMAREKTVFLNAQDAANVVNTLQKAPPNKHKSNRRSMRDRKTKNIREYTPIREEDSRGLDEQHRSSDSEQFDKSPRNTFPRDKRSYCQSMDPDEKVYDWLKRATRRKTEGYKRGNSPTNSVTTEILRQTRAMPRTTRVLENDLSIIDFDEDGRSSVMEKRTIIQTRQKVPSEMGNPRPRLSLTENKAKRLVDKLVKAPMRSSENNVGPGLSMKRQNAFVG